MGDDSLQVVETQSYKEKHTPTHTLARAHNMLKWLEALRLA